MPRRQRPATPSNRAARPERAATPPAPLTPRRPANAPKTEAPVAHVASAESLSRLAAQLAQAALGHSTESATPWTRDRRLTRLAWVDRRLVVGGVRSLWRWRGWLDGVEGPVEEKLLISGLLDAREVSPLCRPWASRVGRDPHSLFPAGDAPDWNAKTEAFKRLLGRRPSTLDPWRLFPPWFRAAIPQPPGDTALKARFVALIHALQTQASLWTRAQGPRAERVWSELRGLGIKPWIHRRLTNAARLDTHVEVAHLAPFERGDAQVHELASQLIAHCGDPHPGERWWVPRAERPQEALHLAALMQGKGLVVGTHVHEPAIRTLTLQARATPYRNVTTKRWDGRHVVGRAASYEGVLVTPLGSNIGTWRRTPEARWGKEPDLARLAGAQSRMLDIAARGVRPSGLLVYAVPTLTVEETRGAVRAFLERHPEFRLKPFAHPLLDEPTDGTLTIWPQEADTEAGFVARFARATQ